MVPAADVRLFSTPEIDVRVLAGPFRIDRGVMIDLSGPGIAHATMGVQTLEFPQGAYLATAQRVVFDDGGEAQARARVAVAEVTAVCDLLFPGWVVEKAYEGQVNVGNSCAVIPEGSVSLRSWTPRTYSEIQEQFRTGYLSLQSLPQAERERYRLMSRWYRKATETDNPIDRFLFLYMSLEVFPARGTADVPRHVTALLHRSAFSELSPGVVKDRLGLGRLAGMRARIVHDGKVVIPNAERLAFDAGLRILEGVAHECLNLLANRQYTGQLDRWVRPSGPTDGA